MKEVKFTSITDALCYAFSRHFITISYSFQESKLFLRSDDGVVEYCHWECNPHMTFESLGHLFQNKELPKNQQPELYFVLSGIRESYIKFRLAFSSAKYVQTPDSIARYLLTITNDPTCRIISTAIDSMESFHLFSYIFGYGKIDCQLLDNTIGYNYELKKVIDDLRSNLDHLESKVFDHDNIHSSISDLRVHLNFLENLMS